MEPRASSSRITEDDSSTARSRRSTLCPRWSRRSPAAQRCLLDGGVRRGTDVVHGARAWRPRCARRPSGALRARVRRLEGRRAGARDPSRGDGERARAARLPLAVRRDSRARHAGAERHGRRRAHAQRRARPAQGRARGEARAWPTAPREARHRRHLARHPRRTAASRSSACAPFRTRDTSASSSSATTRRGSATPPDGQRSVRSCPTKRSTRTPQTYLEQAFQILVCGQTEVRLNSEWLAGSELRRRHPPRRG